MRLIKLAITLVVLAGFGLFAATVPLGDKTLWEHTKAIAGSKEAQQLVDGVKSAVGSGSSSGSGAKAREHGTDEGKLSKADRDKLRDVIRDELRRQRDRGKHAEHAKR